MSMAYYSSPLYLIATVAQGMQSKAQKKQSLPDPDEIYQQYPAGFKAT